MPIISLTGPDGAGKSTLARAISDQCLEPAVILHQSYRFRRNIPAYHLAVLLKAIRLSRASTTVVLDRWWHCEYVYAGVHRGGTSWPQYGRLLHRLADAAGVFNCLCLLQPGAAGKHMEGADREELYRDASKAEAVSKGYRQLAHGVEGGEDTILTGYAAELARRGGLLKIDVRRTCTWQWQQDPTNIADVAGAILSMEARADYRPANL